MRTVVIGKRSMVANALSQVLAPFEWISFLEAQSFDFSGVDRVINCVAFTDVDRAEDKVDEAHAVNVEFVKQLCQMVKGNLIHYSTDYLFDGNSTLVYSEEALPHPINVYGRTKLQGEQIALDHGALVIRTSWVYGENKSNFVSKMLERMQKQEEVKVVADQVGTTTYALDLARATEALSSQSGLFHFANRGVVSRFEWAKAIYSSAKNLGFDLQVKEMIPVESSSFPTKAKRPPFSPLATSKYAKVVSEPRKMEEALDDYLRGLK